MRPILLLFILLPMAAAVSAATVDSICKVLLDPLHISDNQRLTQQLYIRFASSFESELTLTYSIAQYDITSDKDSQLVCSKIDSVKMLPKNGVAYTTVFYAPNQMNTIINPVYKTILQKNGTLPAGKYHSYLTVYHNSDTLRQMLIHTVDSALSKSSKSRNELDNIYAPSETKSLLGVPIPVNKTSAQLNNTYSILRKNAKKVDKVFYKKGYTVAYRNKENKTLVDVFFQNRFVGYYEIDMDGSIKERIHREKERLTSNVATGVKNELENSKTVFSQLKELYEESKKKEITGNITVTGNLGTGQEEYSQNENNYYEIGGQMVVPIMNIPVSMEGYYTSQDKNRIAKASYIRLHYDTEQAKAELLKLIAGYRGKYDEAISKGKGLDAVYNTYLNKLEGEKDKLLSELKAETGVADISNFQLDTTGMLKEIASNYEKKLTDTLKNAGDSSGVGKTVAKATKTKDTVMQLYNKALRKYEQIKELETKMRKYYTLLEQYRNSNYFDSVLAYDKIKDISNGNADEKTYKELAKSAASLLPEGTAKKFISGLTSLDAGIINKQVSSYTLNGQTLKGIDLGYDLGFCETGFTYGRVEYVTRDGQLDRYNGYSARASFKPAKGQKASIVYYGYMPSRKMLNEGDFFKNVDIDMPTFKDPIHIVSAVYTGTVNSYLNIEAEGATSFRRTTEFKNNQVNDAATTTETKTNDKFSYKIAADGSIPGTSLNIRGEMEHIGKQFENNSLPMNMSGTDRYSVNANGQFFKNFLTLGVEYNYLVQQNFANKSANSKWGFNLKTTSKRYPSFSLSYKPFTTFRSFADTFNIPQRPILGEVWLGKLSYQIKKKTYVLRLTAIYNKNTALVDSFASGSNIAQLNAIYTRNKLNLMLNMGQTESKASVENPVHGKTNFINLAFGYPLSKQIYISIGQDIGTAAFGLSHYATNLGCGYRFKRTPLSIRANFRYNTYRFMEKQDWKKLYAGTLDMSWDFKFKMKEKNKQP